MITGARRIKDLIRNRAGGDSGKAQMLLRHFAMERLLERLSVSDYCDDFVIKGGMLVASLISVDRTTGTGDVVLPRCPKWDNIPRPRCPGVSATERRRPLSVPDSTYHRTIIGNHLQRGKMNGKHVPCSFGAARTGNEAEHQRQHANAGAQKAKC